MRAHYARATGARALCARTGTGSGTSLRCIGSEQVYPTLYRYRQDGDMYVHSFSGAVRGFPIKVYTHFWGYPPELVKVEVLKVEVLKVEVLKVVVRNRTTTFSTSTFSA